MQQILDMLKSDGGLAQMAKELGVDETMVSAGAAALLPAVMGGFKQVAASQGGVEGLMGMLGQMGGGGLLDAVVGADPTPTAPGQQILSQILGGNAQSAVLQQAAGATGLNPQMLQSMLPMLAMAAAGFMSKQAAAGGGEGGLGGLVGQVMGALTGNAQAGGLAGVSKLLDMDGDGNPLNDIMKLMGR
jgi:hypothetical protein